MGEALAPFVVVRRKATMMVALFAAMLVTFASAHAWAIEMHTSVDGALEAGGDIEVTLQASSTSDMPPDPLLSVPAGLSVTGTSASRQSQLSLVNGVISAHRVLIVTFTVHTTAAGKFTVTPSVKVDGKRTNGPSARINVVAAGTLAQRQQPQGFNPFDPFGFFGQQDPVGQQDDTPHLLVDPKLGMAAPRGQTAFLHAVVDKGRAVVGEQVTLTVYLYVDTQAREPDFRDPHEATSNDFVRKSLMKDDTTSEDAGYAAVAGRTYVVRVLRRIALFALKTGDLEIGAMSLAVAAHGGVRESEKLSVLVVDAPIAGRPAGYDAGNVGRFTITSDVTPRTVERGSVVGVDLSVDGVGNLPSELSVPLQAGVKWLDPEVHERLANTAGRYGGHRTFSYVVRVEREGDVDLGTIELPFYDADKHAYDVARAALGMIHVTHSDAPAAESARPTLPELPAMRRTLGGPKAQGRHLTDHTWAWALLAFGPFAFAFATASRGIVARFRTRAAERRTSPLAVLAEKQRAQDTALENDDAGAIDAATIRMLEAAVLAHLKKNLRAATGEALVRELHEAGAPRELGQRLRDLLASCEAARFAPDGATSKGARDRAALGRKLAGELAKAKV